jgi:apolipoprotein N-acyltransferase
VVIWLERRRDKGRPAPKWEKVWAVVGWSQPLAFGMTAIVALLFGANFLIATYFATVLVASALALFTSNGQTTARVLRLLSALAMLAAVGTHLHIWWGHITDPMAWYVDVTIVFGAAAIAVPLLIGRSHVRPAVVGP